MMCIALTPTIRSQGTWRYHPYPTGYSSTEGDRCHATQATSGTRIFSACAKHPSWSFSSRQPMITFAGCWRLAMYLKDNNTTSDWDACCSLWAGTQTCGSGWCVQCQRRLIRWKTGWGRVWSSQANIPVSAGPSKHRYNMLVAAIMKFTKPLLHI
eukprot:5591717-Amphidinium_carterae.1